LKHPLLTLARNERSRECLLLLESILETPGLLPRLTEVLRPKKQGTGNRDQGTAAPAAIRNLRKGRRTKERA
jgi:hypothetical protein